MSLGIMRLIGSVVFLYLLWRYLRDNYDDQKIIAYSWGALLSFLAAGRVTYGLINWGVWNDSWWDWVAVWNKPGMSYIGGFLGLVLMTWGYCRQQQWKFINFAEDISRPFLVYTWFLMTDEWLRSKLDWKLLIYLLMLVLIFLVNKWLSNRYRSFTWYKSGKKGFVLLSTGFLFFLGLSLVLILFKERVINVILALVISLISLAGLYILGNTKYERK
jgi:hypothetical protein